jgi:DNA-binding CsgD family transcriptional regulator
MSKKPSFNVLSRRILETWLATKRETPADASSIYSSILDDLSIRNRITQYFPSDSDPLDWWMKPVRHNGGVTKIPGFGNLFIEGRIGEFRDREYVQSALLPSLSEAVRTQSFSIETVRSRLIGFRIIYDRLMLPQRHPEKPQWVLSITNARMLVSEAKGGGNDVFDDVIVQLLTEGLSAKEIAAQTEMSPRTVEHRIERMKERHGARNITQLVAMMVAAQLAGKG